MNLNDKLSKLSNFTMPKTKVDAVSYENNGIFSAPNGIRHEHLPNFYRIKLQILSGKSGLSHTEIWLPEKWNGIYIGTGNGGMAGSIVYSSLAAYVRGGYAVANTDMGTSRGYECGINNPDVWKDFGWRSTHNMTVAAKSVIRMHYGKEPDYSYFTGGSTGGQQALAEAQRFPNDYDGIIAAVPANNRTMLHTYFLWNHVHLRKPDGRKLFSGDEIEFITNFATRFFSKIDGTNDNFIAFPRSSENLINDFISALTEEHKFTEEQLQALKAIYLGPVNPITKERIYNGMPMGSEIYGCGIEDCQQSQSPHYYPFIWAFGKDYSPYSFDFSSDLERLNELLADDLNANDADLAAFRLNGGKLLIYSGSADPCVPFPDAMHYYERLLDKMGGYKGVSEFCRYFLVPGRDHGGGGRGANALKTADGESEIECIRKWREQGIAPDSLKAFRYKNIGGDISTEFERYIYPYGSPNFPLGQCPPVCSNRYLGQNK